MPWSVTSSALAAALVLAPVAAGNAPALCQDFSITNQLEPASAGRRDLMRQLQAWWDVHAYYPRHASNNDEGGTVKVHLVIRPDGRIWMIDVVESSGSRSLDTAGSSVFRGGSVRPFPTESEPNAEIDISLHYVLAHRHDQPVAAGGVQEPIHHYERSGQVACSGDDAATDLHRNDGTGWGAKSPRVRDAFLGSSNLLSQA